MRTIPPIVSGTATYIGDVRLPGHAPRPGRPSADARVEADLGREARQEGVPEHADRRQGEPRRGRSIRSSTGDPGRVGARPFDEVDRVERAAGEREPVLGDAQARLDDRASADRRQHRERRRGVASAATKLSATYEYPYEKHAPIGPTAAVADCRSDGTVVRAHAQPEPGRDALADLEDARHAAREGRRARGTTAPAITAAGNGGSTGAEEEAVILSKAVGKPVRLQWMRWDDMQWSTQHPAAYSDVTAGLDSSGKLVAFRANHYMPAMQDDRMVGALLAGLPTITAPRSAPYPGTFGSHRQRRLGPVGLRQGSERAPGRRTGRSSSAPTPRRRLRHPDRCARPQHADARPSGSRTSPRSR